MPKISKSSRHSKITGDFAEYLILYWLSKHGVECARVDHVGMDLIARLELNQKPIGISVKSRSRNPGTEGQYLNIPNDNFSKLNFACESFGCEPYFGIVVDERNLIRVFLLHSQVLQELHPQRKRVAGWKMTGKWLSKYESDPRIIKFQLSTKTQQWWNN